MQPPLVTIVTAVYDRASFLGETISSIVTQDYPRVEYVLLDDGSNDDSLKIIKESAAKHPMIRFDYHKNIGETRTVNKGLAMARGEIIAVVSSDDPLLPGAIKGAVEVLTQNPEALVAYPDWYLIDEQSRILKQCRTVDYSYLNMIRWHHCIPGPGAFFRRSLVDRLEGRDEQFRYVADFDFWLRAGLFGSFVRIPRTLATFRWHPGGASSREQGLSMAEEHIRLITKIYSIPNLKDDVLAVRKEAFSSAYHEAAVVLGDKELDTKKEFFLRAMTLCPSTYLRNVSRLSEPLALILLGPRGYLTARRMYSGFHRKRIKRGEEVPSAGRPRKVLSGMHLL